MNTQVLANVSIAGYELDIYGTAKEPLFLAKDIASLLGIKNVSQFVRDVDEDEKGVYTVYHMGKPQQKLFLRECGVYESLAVSRKPIARQVKKEVRDALGKIRQNESESYTYEKNCICGFVIIPNSSDCAKNVISICNNLRKEVCYE